MTKNSTNCSEDQEVTEEIESPSSVDIQDNSDIIEVLNLALENTKNELESVKDQLLRAHAEMQNTKRRVQIDLEKSRKFALEKFVAALLPIIDSLERGLSQSSEQQENPVREGMELTLKLFVDTLLKFNVVAIDPESEPFNPEYHQAISQVENENVQPGTIVNVIQKGYTLNNRLIRPAMVVVAKQAG